MPVAAGVKAGWPAQWGSWKDSPAADPFAKAWSRASPHSQEWLGGKAPNKICKCICPVQLDEAGGRESRQGIKLLNVEAKAKNSCSLKKQRTTRA